MPLDPHTFLHPPLISDLLAAHSTAVKEVLSIVEKFIEANKANKIQEAVAQLEGGADELYALRFVLSAAGRQKDSIVHQASANLIKSLEWRSENLDMLRGVVLTDDNGCCCSAPEFKSFNAGNIGMFPCNVTQFGLVDYRDAKGAKLSSNDIEVRMYRYHEALRMVLDRRTRATGRLIKVVGLIDLKGMSVLRMDLRALQTQGAVSKLHEVILPQLLAVNILLNTGIVFKTIFSMASPLFSKGTLDKLVLCRGTNLEDNSLNQCPFASKFVDLKSTVPKIYGGERLG